MALINAVARAFICIACYEYSAGKWIQMSGAGTRLWLILSACDRGVCKLTGPQSIKTLTGDIACLFLVAYFSGGGMVIVEFCIDGWETERLVLTR